MKMESVSTDESSSARKDPSRSLKAESIRHGVMELRRIVKNELSDLAPYLYPILDDRESARQWTSGQARCWPRARCLFNREGDDEGCFRLDLTVVANTDLTEKIDFERPRARIRSQVASSSKGNAIESAIRGLAKTELPRTCSPDADIESKAISVPARVSLIDIISHLYETPLDSDISVLEKKRKHANFVKCFGVQHGKESSFLFTRASGDLHLGSFFAFNRHCLSLFRDQNGEGGEVPSFESSTKNGKVIAPILVGTSPVTDEHCDIPARFIFYQCLKALEFLHQMAPHGSLCPEAFSVSEDLWVELRPPSSLARQSQLKAETDGWGVINATEEWRRGKFSNFEYLMILNQVAGRRTGGVGSFHSILPWVKDFDGNKPRDMTRSKFRLKKGDRQLDTTFAVGEGGLTSRLSKKPALPAFLGAPASSKELRLGHLPQLHHIPESLSNLTYYVYTARVSPIRALQRVVRQNFEPKEYPSSMARLFEWTPDECIPEFFIDHALFLPANGLNCLLCGKLSHAASDDEGALEAELFLQDHSELLESASPESIASWIDLNFGAALQGRLAVENKNVVLVPRGMLDSFQLRPSPEFTCLFDRPHPSSKIRANGSPLITATSRTLRLLASMSPSSSFRIDRADTAGGLTEPEGEIDKPEDDFLLSVFQAMLAPRDGLRVAIQQTPEPSLLNATTLGNEATLAGFGGSFQTNDMVSHQGPSVASEPKLTFLGSDLVEWLIRRHIPGVASTGDAAALAQRMMNAGFFFPLNRDFDDFVDADDVYVFRERKDVQGRWKASRIGEMIQVARPFGGFETGDFVDAGLGGLFYTPDYTRHADHDSFAQDHSSLALIIAQLYLGSSLKSMDDLDTLPMPVSRTLKTLLGRTSEVDLLKDRNAFPEYFEYIWNLLAAVHLSKSNDSGAKRLCEGLRAMKIDKPDRHYALWLVLPLCSRLMKADSLSYIGDIYMSLLACFGMEEHSLIKSAVDAAFKIGEGSPEGLNTRWTATLPIELFLDKYIDVFVASRGESTTVTAALEAHLSISHGEQSKFSLGRAAAMVKARCPNPGICQELVSRLVDLTKSGTKSFGAGTAISSKAARDSQAVQLSTMGSDNNSEEDNSEDEGGMGEMNSSSATRSLSVIPAVAPFKRAVHHRQLLHADAVVSCMTSSSSLANISFMASGSKKGEVAIWEIGSTNFIERAKLRIGDVTDNVQSLRFSPFTESLFATSAKGGSGVIEFAQGSGSSMKMSTWFPSVRCIEPFAQNRDILCLGDAQGDVILADRRASRTVTTLSMCLSGTSPTGPVRTILSVYPFTLYSASGDRIVEHDVRVSGRLVREWRTLGKVTRLMELGTSAGEGHSFACSSRCLVSVMKGGLSASIWDVSHGLTIPRERLRAFAGFDDALEQGPVEAGGGDPGAVFSSMTQNENWDDADSLIAQVQATDPNEGPFLYAVRGTHKLARVPLKLHDAPLEVRVRPLSLTNERSNKRFSRGSLSLTAACVLPGQVLTVAGYDASGFDGGYAYVLS